jgi:hypothetical protein
MSSDDFRDIFGTVIASQGRANARPMTGSAKQSILPLRGEMDCFASLAMTRNSRYASAFPRR